MTKKQEMPFDQVDLKVMHDVATYGWSDMCIFPTTESPGLPFNYTVGFAELNHPDLILIGLNNHQGHGVLQAAYEGIKKGMRYRADNCYGDIVQNDMLMAFVEVLDPMGDFPMSMTRRLYGQVDALQLVWPDREGRFPWDSRFDPEFREQQPLLGVWRGV